MSAIEDRHPGVLRYGPEERPLLTVGRVLDLSSQMFGNLRGFRHGKNVGIGNLVLLFGDPVEGEQGMADRDAAGVSIPAGAVPRAATATASGAAASGASERPGAAQYVQGLASAVRVGRGGPGELSGSRAGDLEKVRFFFTNLE